MNLVTGSTQAGAGVRGIKWETPFTLLSCGYDTTVRLWDTRLHNHRLILVILFMPLFSNIEI